MHTGTSQVYVFSSQPRLRFISTHLGDAQLAGGQLLLVLVHLLVALWLGALQLLAAFCHGLHFWLHLTDVETGHCELLVDHAAALMLLEGWRGKTTWRKKGGEEIEERTRCWCIWSSEYLNWHFTTYVSMFVTTTPCERIASHHPLKQFQQVFLL